jgi:hypothetical protein
MSSRGLLETLAKARAALAKPITPVAFPRWCDARRAFQPNLLFQQARNELLMGYPSLALLSAATAASRSAIEGPRLCRRAMLAKSVVGLGEKG